MAQKDLHEVIIEVLQSSKKALTVREITDIISTDKLWFRPKDGKLPNVTQVSARVNNYKHLFSRDGVVTLKQKQKVEDRISRLTFNTNGWTSPSGPEGKSKLKTSYETKNGYGHEEWLLDFSKIINGYHYASLQPINANRDKYIGSTFNIYLYTVNSTTNEKYWVGKIRNAEVVDGSTSKKIKKIYQAKRWLQEMKDELKDLELDEKTLDRWDGAHLFNIRFKIDDFEKYPDNTLITKGDNSITSYHYVLLHLTEGPKIEEEADGKFILGRCKPGRRFSGKSIKKKFEEKIIEYPFVHHQLSRALENTLKDEYDKVYAEHDTGYRTSIDIVAVKGGKKCFFEIKTFSDIKSAIRQALGQLLEYGYYPDKKLADKLFIVTQHELKDNRLINYIKNLRKKTNIPIFYMWYDLKGKKIGQVV